MRRCSEVGLWPISVEDMPLREEAQVCPAEKGSALWSTCVNGSLKRERQN